jgi:hypothetical protein
MKYGARISWTKVLWISYWGLAVESSKRLAVGSSKSCGSAGVGYDGSEESTVLWILEVGTVD